MQILHRFSTTKLLTASVLTFGLSMSGGCFYLVHDGHGGVAERYPVPLHQRSFQERLDICTDVYIEHLASGLDRHFPATYSEVRYHLVQSRRLYSAHYMEHALVQLQQAESLLRKMNNEYTRRLLAPNPECKHANPREFCL